MKREKAIKPAHEQFAERMVRDLMWEAGHNGYTTVDLELMELAKKKEEARQTRILRRNRTKGKVIPYGLVNRQGVAKKGAESRLKNLTGALDMNRSECITRIEVLRDKRDEIAEQINDEAKAAFQVGSSVSFCKGRGCINAAILWFSKGLGESEPCFGIRSHTGREYRVTLYDLIGRKRRAQP